MTIKTAELQAHKVHLACVKYLNRRRERIDKERAELVEKYKQPYFFGMFTRTEEQALAAAQKDDEWYYASCRGGWGAHEVEELAVLCDKAMQFGKNRGNDATVIVDAEVVGIISNFMKD